LLDLLDELFQVARPRADEEDAGPADRRAAGERARLLSESVATEPRFLSSLLTAARSDAGSRRPETIEFFVWLAEKNGRLNQAESLLRTAVSGPAGNKTTVVYAFLHWLSQQHRWDELLSECSTDRVQNSPRTFWHHVFKAEAEAELGQGGIALRTIDGLARNPQFSAKFLIRRQRVRLLGILGRYQEMADECVAAMREHSAADEIHTMRLQLSEAYLGLSQFEKAEDELRKLLEEDPDDVLVLNNLGYNLADQGRKLDEAEAMIRRAVELDHDERARAGFAIPEHAAYLDSLGWVLFRKGKLADARGQLEQAAGLADGAADPTVWDHLGDVCFRLGDKPKAKEAWGKAAALYENSHVGRQFGRFDEVKRKLRLE
jgi:tetratricopeptide (TPR) repeat protein